MSLFRFSLKALLFLFIFGCGQNEIKIPVQSQLQNEKGWYTTKYKRTDIGVDSEFLEEPPPYIILGEYGSALLFRENEFCYPNYSDGSQAVQKGSVVLNWEVLGEDKILFSSQHSEDIMADIIELNGDQLWIRYEQSGDLWEYILDRIE